jgi:hypothetical protein
LNILYRFEGNMRPRLFAGLLYGDKSLRLVPGFRINPLPNIDVYFALPVNLGSKDGHYYQNSQIINDQLRPISLLLYVTFSGSLQVNR